jgi:hypothetical protein
MTIVSPRQIKAWGIAALAMLGLAVTHPARAADPVYYGSNGTLSTSVSTAVVGYADDNDLNHSINGTSPTVGVITGAAAANGLYA